MVDSMTDAELRERVYEEATPLLLNNVTLSALEEVVAHIVEVIEAHYQPLIEEQREQAVAELVSKIERSVVPALVEGRVTRRDVDNFPAQYGITALEHETLVELVHEARELTR